MTSGRRRASAKGLILQTMLTSLGTQRLLGGWALRWGGVCGVRDVLTCGILRVDGSGTGPTLYSNGPDADYCAQRCRDRRHQRCLRDRPMDGGNRDGYRTNFGSNRLSRRCGGAPFPGTVAPLSSCNVAFQFMGSAFASAVTLTGRNIWRRRASDSAHGSLS
jgi:hypothetical protein